jgi:hypothetical protein
VKSHLQHTVDKLRIGYERKNTAHPAVMYRTGAGDRAGLGANRRIHTRTFALQIR